MLKASRSARDRAAVRAVLRGARLKPGVEQVPAPLDAEETLRLRSFLAGAILPTFAAADRPRPGAPCPAAPPDDAPASDSPRPPPRPRAR